MAETKTPMEIVAEVHEEEPKKIFFFARGPMDNTRAWAELWDRKKATDYIKTQLKEAGLEDRPFESYRVERHSDDGEVRVWSWGESSPSATFDDYGSQKGLLVELDGKEVFNNLEEIEEDD
jgi:hypothetical protein